MREVTGRLDARQDWSRLVSAAVLGVVSLALSVVVEIVEAYPARPIWWWVLDGALGVVAVYLLLWRRRWPWAIAIALAAFSAISVASTGAALVVFVSLVARRPWHQGFTVGAVWVSSALTYELLNRPTLDVDPPWLVVGAAQVCSVVACAILGVALRGWRRDGFPPIFGEIWRVLLAALPFGLVILAVSMPFPVDESGEPVPYDVLPEWWWFIDLALAAVSCALVLLRRRWPVPVLVTTAAISLFSASSAGAMLLIFISVCTRRNWRWIAIGAPVVLASMVIGETWFASTSGAEDTWTTNLVVFTLITAVCVAIGLYIGSRRDHMSALRERAETAEREQASRVAEARTGERARIAREMHDVLAHRISLIAMHSGALAYRSDLPPEEVREIAGMLRDNADQAVQELRTVLGVLRATHGEPLRPQPTLSALDELITEAEAGAMTVELDRSRWSTDPLPEATSRTAYRIIQESLTNARKHAPGSRVDLSIAGDPDAGLTIELRNPVPSDGGRDRTGSGMGLVGLTERAVIAGGQFSYGTDRAQRFVVRAWLPWSS